MKNGQFVRQGDILVKKRAEPIPATATPIDGPAILAEGETTGHHHQVREGAAILEIGEDRFLRMMQDAPLVHEEHEAIPASLLSVGEYDIVRQVEWTDEDEPRQVSD